VRMLAGLPEATRCVVVRSATVATVVLLAATLVLGLPLRTPASPLGIVSLQLATSPAAAASVLDAWASVPRMRLLWAHGLDLLLPVAYALAIASAAAGARSVLGRRHLAAPIAAGAAVVAAIADQVENLAMVVTILIAPTWASVLVTLVGATVKFAMLALAVGALVATLAAVRARGVSS
jgi:hypothetical protein